MGLGAHLIDVRGTAGMGPPPVPGMSGHDVVDAGLFEPIENRGLDIPEPGPPAILPRTQYPSSGSGRSSGQNVSHECLHGPHFAPVEHFQGNILDFWRHPAFEMLTEPPANPGYWPDSALCRGMVPASGE